MILVSQRGNEYELKFSYNPELIQIVKDVPGRRWVPEKKIWTLPLDKLGWFLNAIKGTSYEYDIHIQSEEDLNVNAELGHKTLIPDIDISDVKFQVAKGLKPFQHQLDFMKFAIDRQNRGNMRGLILADEMGLAKTMQVANLALYNKKKYKFKHCLIICAINTSKYNWVEDIKFHTNGNEVPYILGTRLKKDGVTIRSNTGSAEKLKDLTTGHMYGDKKQPKLPYFIVMNIEGLRHRQGRIYPIADEICKWIDSGKINMIAIDEVHKNTSPSSLQGKQLLRIKKYTGSKCEWIPMTGTPIVNKPTDVFLPLKLIDGHKFSSYYMWENHFCLKGGFGGHEIIGYKNIPELKQMLEGNMIRRLKEDVLDLPDKIFFTEYVENTPYQTTLYNKVANDIISQKDNILRGLNPLSSMMRLRQVNDAPEIVDLDLKVDKGYLAKNAKMKRLIELLDEAYERGEKSLVFSNWVEPLRTLYKFVSKRYGTCCYTGTMSLTDREKHKKAFQSNPKYSIMIGTIGAMGTSHNLNAAHNVFFLDEPWTCTDKNQAIDRAHRANTTHPVNIVTLIVKDTVDDRVHDIVYNKDQISKYIVDGKVDLRNNPELFDLLLSDTKK